MEQNGGILCVAVVVKMQAKKHKGWYDNKRAKVVRINSKAVVVQLLEGDMKGCTKTTPFETEEIVEPANPPTKPRVDVPEPEVEDEEAESVEPAIPVVAPKQNGKPAPDEQAMQLFGDLELYD